MMHYSDCRDHCEDGWGLREQTRGDPWKESGPLTHLLLPVLLAGHYYYYIGWSVVTIISGETVLTIMRGKRSFLQLPILERMDTWQIFSRKKMDIWANLFLIYWAARSIEYKAKVDMQYND